MKHPQASGEFGKGDIVPMYRHEIQNLWDGRVAAQFHHKALIRDGTRKRPDFEYNAS